MSSKPSFEELFQLARTLIKKGKYPEALEVLEEIVREYPDKVNPEINYYRGVFYGMFGNIMQALKLLSMAESNSLDGKYPAASNHRGITLLGIKNYEEAIWAFEKAEKDSPNKIYPDASNHRGIALYELKQYEEAIAAFEKAELHSPDRKYPKASFNRGNALGKLKRYEEAILAYKKAESDSPDGKFPFASMNRGDTLRVLKRYEEAISAYKKAELDSPNEIYPDALMNRGNALQELNRCEEAILAYKKAILDSPEGKTSNILINLGNALQKLNRYEEAIQAFEKAEHNSAEGKFPKASYNRGNVLRVLKRYEEAILAYKKAESDCSDGKFPGASNNRGAVLYELMKYEKAIKAYEKAEEDSPDCKHPGASKNRGKVLGQLKRYEDAINAYKKAEEDSPGKKYPDASVDRAFVLRLQRIFYESIRACRKAIQDSEDSHAHARLCLSLNYIDLAKKDPAFAEVIHAAKIDNQDLRVIGNLCTHFANGEFIEGRHFERYQNRQQYLLHGIDTLEEQSKAYAEDTLDKYRLPVYYHLEKFLLVLEFEQIELPLNLNLRERLTLAYLTAYSHTKPWITYYLLDEVIDGPFDLDDMDHFFYLNSAIQIADHAKDLVSIANLQSPNQSPVFYSAFQKLSQAVRSAAENEQFIDGYLLKIDTSLLQINNQKALAEVNNDLIRDALQAVIEKQEYAIPLSENVLNGLLIKYLIHLEEKVIPDFSLKKNQETHYINFLNSLKEDSRDYEIIANNIRAVIKNEVSYKKPVLEIAKYYMKARSDEERNNLAILQSVCLVSHYLDYQEKPMHDSLLLEIAVLAGQELFTIINPLFRVIRGIIITILTKRGKKMLKIHHDKTVDAYFEALLAEIRPEMV